MRPVSAQLECEWPYVRENPDCVVLGVRPGVTPSGKPPVRIFLGTEEGQYRAERVFVFSVEKHRDPARVYEIHLMKNVTGFDRRGWRTGFTCYRFAIPDFAGRQGKAIYNDVDQIYLADPALLFDLDLGGHGYLAIDARDTSVMLIDCQRMLPWWNRERASKRGAKGPLTAEPAKVPGLWGRLDPHWNARDQEYVEGRTKCLHYTLLHQQPWHPFPETYSYHENPLAHLWYALEREADAAGFEVFTRERPSPGFLALLGSNRPQPPQAEPEDAAVLTPAAKELLETTGVRHLLVIGLGGAQEAAIAGSDLVVTRHDLARTQGALPDERFDGVLAAGIFERIPGADANWMLHELFAAAGRALVLRIHTTADAGVGSASWWRRRIELVAARFPQTSWQLDAVARAATGRLQVATTQVRKVAPPSEPLTWVLTGEDAGSDDQARRIAAAVGGRVEEKPLVFGPRAELAGRLLRNPLGGIDTARSATLTPPWPDVAVLAGARALPVGRWLRAQSGGRTRLVQLGRPGGAFTDLDLIVARPEDRLPVRPNVVQVAAPLLGPAPPPAATAAEAKGVMAGLARPVTVLLLTTRTAPYVLNETTATALGQAAAAEAARYGGALLLCSDGSVSPKLLAAVQAASGGGARCIDAAADGSGQRDLLLAAADRFILISGDAEGLAETCPGGKPVALFELPRWYDDLPVVQPVVRMVLPILGGKTYRGTPLQQHLPGRFIDWLTTKGLLHRPRDLEALYRSLEGRGLLHRLGEEERVRSPRPLDDLERVAERVRHLLAEVSRAA